MEPLYLGMYHCLTKESALKIASPITWLASMTGKGVGKAARFGLKHPGTTITGLFVAPGALHAYKESLGESAKHVGGMFRPRKNLLDPGSPMNKLF